MIYLLLSSPQKTLLFFHGFMVIHSHNFVNHECHRFIKCPLRRLLIFTNYILVQQNHPRVKSLHECATRSRNIKPILSRTIIHFAARRLWSNWSIQHLTWWISLFSGNRFFLKDNACAQLCPCPLPQPLFPPPPSFQH